MPNTTALPPLFIATGEQRALRVPGLLRYSVGTRIARVVRLAPRRAGDPHTLLIKGVSPGSTDLWVWKSDGTSETRTLEVRRDLRPTWPAALAQALRELGGPADLEILQIPTGALLRGSVHDEATASAIARALILAPPGALRDETELSEELAARGRKRLSAWLDAFRSTGALALETRGRRLVLRGAVRSPQEQARIEREARRIFPLVDCEIEALPDEAPTVSFKVHLLEISRSRALDVGLRWPEMSSGFQFTPQAALSWGQFGLSLRHLQSSGAARILSSPELVLRAPGEAELFSGGELPIKLASRFGTTLVWKTFGLSLKLRVTHVTGARVRFEISSETSHLDRAIAVDDVPGLRANKLKTQADATFGEPLLLTGLIRQEASENGSGLPLLSQIPGVGLLFGSQSANDTRSELVAIVLPSPQPGRAPLERIRRLSPRGPLLPPRDWLGSEDESALRESPDFPWNAPWKEEE